MQDAYQGPSYKVIGRGAAGSGHWYRFPDTGKARQFLADPNWVFSTPDGLLAKLGVSKVREVSESLQIDPKLLNRNPLKLAEALFASLLARAVDPDELLAIDGELKTHPQVVRFFNVDGGVKNMVAQVCSDLHQGWRTVFVTDEGRRMRLLDVGSMQQGTVFKEVWAEVKTQPFEFREAILWRMVQRHLNYNNADRCVRAYIESVLPKFGTYLEPKAHAQAADPVTGQPKVVKVKKEATYEVLYDPKNKAHAKKLESLPRQAQLLVTALSAEAAKTSAVLSLGAAESLVVGLREQLKTKQDPWRVFKFYQAKFISLDLLRLKTEA